MIYQQKRETWEIVAFIISSVLLCALLFYKCGDNIPDVAFLGNYIRVRPQLLNYLFS